MLRWLFLATLSAILLLQLRGLDSPLRTPDTPQGIVGFELAATRTEAARMLEAWRAAGVLEAAKVSLGVDMGFLLAYPFFLRSTVGGLRRRVRAGRLARGGRLAGACRAGVPPAGPGGEPAAVADGGRGGHGVGRRGGGGVRRHQVPAGRGRRRVVPAGAGGGGAGAAPGGMNRGSPGTARRRYLSGIP